MASSQKLTEYERKRLENIRRNEEMMAALRIHSKATQLFSNSSKRQSMDNTVGIVTGVNFEHISIIEHDTDNQKNSRIASFRAIWGWDDSYIFIGNRKRGVDVISSTKKRTIFTSPRMPAMLSRFDAHPYKVGMLAGATCWGHVYIWKKLG